jgi:hypothetical protein
VTSVVNSLAGAALVLLLVGAGNLYVARGNIAKYAAVADDAAIAAPAAPSADFPRLDARMTADVLRPLRQRGGNDGHAASKLAFYRVVETGGWGLCTLGAGCATIAWLLRRRRTTAAPATS